MPIAREASRRRAGRLRRARERGFALAGAVILAFCMAIVGMAFATLAGNETRASQNYLDSQRAFWLAEAGRELAMKWLETQLRPPESDLVLYQGVLGPKGGNYDVEIIVDTTAIYSVEKGFMIDALGTSGGIERRIRQRIKMTSFAQYAYFTDDERSPGGNSIWFVTGDVVEGMMHTNGTLRIHGDPKFLGPVTSSAPYMLGYRSSWWGHYRISSSKGWPAGRNHPLFAEGFELDVPKIPLPTETQDLKSMAKSGGLHIGFEAEVELGRKGPDAGTEAPGWLRYRNAAGGGKGKGKKAGGGNPWISLRLSDLGIPVVYGENDLHVWGVLDGELTISSKKNLWIADDITYLASGKRGRPDPGCDDLLGLVAEKNIVIPYDPAKTNDLIIDAVMMALDTSIYAQHYDNYVVRGDLTIHGGMIQKYRGPIGKFSWFGWLISGYHKDYHYDERVTAYTPPGFPLTGVYQEMAWTESWETSSPF